MFLFFQVGNGWGGGGTFYSGLESHCGGGKRNRLEQSRSIFLKGNIRVSLLDMKIYHTARIIEGMQY